MGILTWGTAPTSRDDNWESLVISEINENDPIPFISNISGDTCPTNYNYQITIYGQNFRPNSTVNIPGVSNLITTVVSPTEIVAQFTSGSIAGAFDIEVKNGDHSSILWGQNNKLNIINATGGNLPLLDTWIDCRFGGSPDGMIGTITKDAASTWSRGIFGYSIQSADSANATWGNIFRLSSYTFGLDIPLSVELVLYTVSWANINNTRWGLFLQGDQSINTVTGFNHVPSATQSYFFAGYGTVPNMYQVLRYEAGTLPLNQYIKIKIMPRYIGFFLVNILDFSSLSLIKEFFIPSELWKEILLTFKKNGFTNFEPGLKFIAYGTTLSNISHLTAFKLSWA